jgi:hypothetical protein
MNRRYQEGFGAVEIVVVCLVLLALGATGFLFFKHKTRPVAATVTNPAASIKQSALAQTSNPDPYAGWKTYISTADHFSLKYPTTWTLDATNAPSGAAGYDAATLTSPSKTVLNLYANGGGKGGWCTPAPQDVPFRTGNACATREYLSSEKLAVNNLY